MAQRFIKQTMRFFNVNATPGSKDYSLLTDYLSKNKMFQQAALTIHDNIEVVQAYCRKEWNIDLHTKKLENKRKSTKNK
jgi:hydroxyacyl-ACP dehydratase HTD2-like protein with hotdog domain